MKKETSWQKVGSWYDQIVGDLGSYYHKQIILPGTLRLLGLTNESSLLDLGCGQGVLAGAIAKEVGYVGLDAAKSLLQKAKTRHKDRKFIFADLTKPLPLAKEALFSHAACILALQNMQDPEAVIQHASTHILKGGKLVLILNHPCFRIPRQSSWGFDEQQKMQYRRLNCYMSEQEIPIVTNPGQQDSVSTVSFHHPLSHYFGFLQKAHFMVEAMEEWCSDKMSEGKAARWENRARKEFPLFMAIKASKIC